MSNNSQHVPTGVPSVEFVKITPDQARDWLRQNIDNRPLRDRDVAAYARDITADNWRVTGEGIKFAADGRLLDGQHRLAAIVQADKTVGMYVFRNVDDAAQQVMDSGIKRSVSDAFNLQGQKNTATLAAGARLAFLYDKGLIAGQRWPKITNLEVLDFVDVNPDLLRAAEMATSLKNRVNVQPSVLTVAWWVLARVDVADCHEFFMRLANMQHEGPGDPIFSLLRRLQTAKRDRERVEQATYLAMLFRVWNDWRGGKQRHRMPAESRSGAISIPEPR